METIIIEKIKGVESHFELFKWAMKALSKDSTRYNLSKVYIGKNRVVCCDGARFHMFRHNRSYAPGMYEVKSQDKKAIVLSKVMEATYPDIAKVIPKHGGKKLDFLERSINRGSSYTSVVRYMEPGTTVNLDYFEDCVTEGQWQVTIHPNNGPLYFKDCNRTAVIMPARM